MITTEATDAVQNEQKQRDVGERNDNGVNQTRSVSAESGGKLCFPYSSRYWTTKRREERRITVRHFSKSFTLRPTALPRPPARSPASSSPIVIPSEEETLHNNRSSSSLHSHFPRPLTLRTSRAKTTTTTIILFRTRHQQNLQKKSSQSIFRFYFPRHHKMICAKASNPKNKVKNPNPLLSKYLHRKQSLIVVSSEFFFLRLQSDSLHFCAAGVLIVPCSLCQSAGPEIRSSWTFRTRRKLKRQTFARSLPLSLSLSLFPTPSPAPPPPPHKNSCPQKC
jgi:hypothetical protein